MTICRQCSARLPAGTPDELCPFCVPDEPAPESGRVLGDCELFEEIGRGGMGVVWRGRQRGLDREVAVKTLPGGDLAGADARARFRIEAQAAARLKHPGIVAIHDVGEADGMPYFVMELVRGRTLSETLAGRPANARLAARWLRDAALAVQHAHEHGVLHRDIKPSNIIIEGGADGGRPRVTDFGLAKMTDTDSGLTLTGSAAGSPAFMSPEQARRGESTALSDVYSLGAVLYSALTGRAPFQGESVAAVLAQVERDEPLQPRRLNPGVPRDLETICLRCLEKNPQRRYPGALALAEDLGRFLANEPVLARPAGPLAKTLRWAARRPALAGALTLAVLALIATAAVSTISAQRIGEARNRALASAESEKLQAAEARRRTVDLHVAEANRRQADGDFIGSLPSLVAALRGDSGRRDAHMTRLAAALRECPRVVHHWSLAQWRDRRDPALTYPGRVYSADFSPDGKWLACATMAKAIHFWNVETGEDHGAEFAGDSVVYVKFSADGSRLLTGTSRDTISLWDVEKRSVVFRDLKHDLNGTHPSSLSPPVMDREAKRIVRIEPGDSLTSGAYLVTAGESTAVSIPLRLNCNVRSLALSPDESLLALGLTGGKVVLHESATWAPVGRNFAVGKDVRAMSFSPDNTRIAIHAGGNDTQLWRLDTAAPEQIGRTFTHTGATYTLAWSPAGTHVATSAYGEQSSFVLRADTGMAESVIRQPPGIFTASWSRDGATLLTAGFDNTARFFNPLTGAAKEPPLHHGGYVCVARYSPDGRFIFTGGYDGTARLWQMRLPPAAPPGIANSKSSGSGRFLARRDWKEGSLGMIAVYSMGDGREIGRTGPGRCGGLADDGRTLVWLGGSRFELHEFQPDGKPRTLSAFSFPYQEAPVATREVEISPDARLAVISADRLSLQIFDVSQREARAVGALAHESRATRWTFSPDGMLMATVSARPQREAGSIVIVWRLDDTRELSRFTTPQPVSHIEFSPDSKLLAWGGSMTGLMGASVRVHRCSDGQPATPFLAHRGDIKDIEFSPDSRLIATGSSDGSARLWDVAQARLASPEIPHPHHVEFIGFSRDGLRFVTLIGGASPAMRVWETASAVALTPPMRVSKGSWFCQFTEDGTALISAGDTFMRWPLTDENRTPEDLIAEAELLSGVRQDDVTGPQPIPSAELRALHEQRRKAAPRSGQ